MAKPTTPRRDRTPASSPGDLSLEDRLIRIEAKLDILFVDVVSIKAKTVLVGGVAGALLAAVVQVIPALIK